MLGLLSIKTVRTDINRDVPNISLCLFNPIYNGRDTKIIDTRLQLKPYQIPYIENVTEFKNKIKITTSKTSSNRVVEY